MFPEKNITKENLFTNSYYRQKVENFTVSVAFVLVGIISIFGNIVILIVVWKSEKLRHSQYIYKFSIAISDIIWGSLISFYFICISILSYSRKSYLFIEEEYFVTPRTFINSQNFTVYNYNINTLKLVFTVYNYNNNTLKLVLKDYENIKNVLTVLEYILPTAFLVSIFSLVFAAADRYYALTFPFRYKAKNTLKIAKYCSIIIWIICIFLFLFTIFENVNVLSKTSFLQPGFKTCLNCDIPLNQKVVSTLLFSLFLLMWVLTILTISSLLKNYMKSKKLNRKISKRIALEKQMSFILIVMVLAFTFCLCLTLYSHICYYFCEESYYIETYTSTKIHIALALLATNSIWNFIIYNVMNKSFRTELIKLFRKNKLQTLPKTIFNT